MIITRLIFIALAALLIGFGIHPATEYSNTGAFLMLLFAAILIITTIFLPLLFRIIRKTLLGKLLLIIVIAFTGFFAFIQFNIIKNSHSSSPPPPADAIIILGAGLAYGTEYPSLALSYRLDAALEYLEEHPDTPIIVSGGRGEIEPVSEAYAMQQYLLERGIDEDQIILEDNSNTTAENLRGSAQIAQEHDFSSLLIITSDYHCFRVGLLADRNNLNATCLPAKNVWWLAPADHFREFLAVSNALFNW